MAKIEKKEKNTVHFIEEIGAEEFEKAVQQAYLKNRGQIILPGFRKGRVPRKIIEMNYGSDIFYDEALNEILPEIFERAVEELSLEIVDQPQVDLPDDIVKGEPVKVEFQVDVKPEVELADFDDIKVEDLRFEVTDEIIDQEIDQAREQSARLINVDDRPVEDGDFVNIDFKGYANGEAFEGGEAEGFDLTIGSGAFIPGFEDQLIGMEIGDEKEVNVTFPEEYHEENLAGEDAVFEVKLNDIKIKELPELDDDFVMDVSEFDTVDEYRDDIRKRLEDDFSTREKNERENLVIFNYAQKIDLDIPQGMVNSQVENEIRDLGMRLSQQGMTLEKYLQMTNTDVHTLKDMLEPQAKIAIKNQLILEAIAKQEGLEPTDEEIEKEIEDLAEKYTTNDEDKANFIENLKGDQTNFVSSNMMREKALDFLMDIAQFVDQSELEDEEDVEEPEDVE